MTDFEKRNFTKQLERLRQENRRLKELVNTLERELYQLKQELASKEEEDSNNNTGERT